MKILSILPQWVIACILAAACAAVCISAQTSTTPEIRIVQNSAGVQVSFTGVLQSADTAYGPWMDLMDATNPFKVPTNQPAAFFRAAKKISQMKIKIGSSCFIATLEDNATATAFKALLPMTLNMVELNGNEKYSGLSASLPTNASNPETIRSGDLMIYGSQTLVLFYKTFPTSYSYTRLGRIKDVAGLADAVSSGNVTAAFQLE